MVLFVLFAVITGAAPTITLQNGVVMPQLSAGTGGYDNASAAEAISVAVNAGVLAFHTAYDYSNLPGVRAGLAQAIAMVGRDALFITAMTSPCIHTASSPKRNVSDPVACEKLTATELNATLDQLGLERADLVLLHGPSEPFGYTGACDAAVCALNRAQWRAYSALLAAGRTRAIGVSNYCQSCLGCLTTSDDAEAGEAAMEPVQVNQLQLHVGMGTNAQNLTRYCDAHDIVLQAYGPLASGAVATACPLCASIGARHGNRSAAAVGLRWIAQQRDLLPGLQRPPAIVVKASNPVYMREDASAVWTEEWSLTADDMTALAALTAPTGQQDGRPSWGCAE